MPEPEPAQGLTSRAFLIGLMLVLVWLLYDCTLAVSQALGGIEMLYCMGFGAAFTVFLVTIVNNSLAERVRLSRHELTIIYAMVAVAIPWGLLIRAALEAPLKLTILHTTKQDPTPGFLTGLWCTKSPDAVAMFARGGYMPWEIPWREWRVPILYWSGLLVSFQLFAIFVVLWFRRIFIDEEKLSFPLAAVGQSIIEYRPSKSDVEKERKFQTVIRIAFAVGLLICLPGILSITPDSHTPIPMNSSYYGTSTGILPGLSVTLSWDPFVLCFLMFFPVDVLFTVMVFHVGFRILVPMVCLWIGIPTPKIGNWMFYAFGMGGVFALAFWPAFYNRALLADGIRRAVRGGRSSDTNDPLSFRVIGLGLVLSLAAFVFLFVLGIGDISGRVGTHILSVALCIFVIIAFLLARIRKNAEQGWHYHAPWWIGGTIAHAQVYWFPKPTVWQTQASFLSISHVLQFASYHNTFGPHLHVFDSLKVASQTNTRTRDVMKAVYLTVLITLIVVVPGYLMLIHYYGFDRAATSEEWLNFFSYEQPQHIVAYAATPGIQFGWISLASGIAIIGWVMYMRREHVRFPLNPVGIVMAGVAGSYFPNYATSIIWLPIVIVLVVKRVIYRWFGVGVFRTRVIPVVMQVMMGLMTGMFIYKIIFAALGRGFLRPY